MQQGFCLLKNFEVIKILFYELTSGHAQGWGISVKVLSERLMVVSAVQATIPLGRQLSLFWDRSMWLKEVHLQTLGTSAGKAKENS